MCMHRIPCEFNSLPNGFTFDIKIEQKTWDKSMWKNNSNNNKCNINSFACAKRDYSCLHLVQLIVASRENCIADRLKCGGRIEYFVLSKCVPNAAAAAAYCLSRSYRLLSLSFHLLPSPGTVSYGKILQCEMCMWCLHVQLLTIFCVSYLFEFEWARTRTRSRVHMCI